MPEYSAANRKDIRAAEKAEKAREASRQSVLVGLMSTIEGRAYIYADLEFCHVFVDPFTSDALAEAFQKGIRTVGLKLLADLMQYAPDQFILAMREANERRTAAEYTRSKDTVGGVDRSDSESESRSEFDPYATESGPSESDTAH